MTLSGLETESSCGQSRPFTRVTWRPETCSIVLRSALPVTIALRLDAVGAGNESHTRSTSSRGACAASATWVHSARSKSSRSFSSLMALGWTMMVKFANSSLSDSSQSPTRSRKRWGCSRECVAWSSSPSTSRFCSSNLFAPIWDIMEREDWILLTSWSITCARIALVSLSKHASRPHAWMCESRAFTRTCSKVSRKSRVPKACFCTAGAPLPCLWGVGRPLPAWEWKEDERPFAGENASCA
mmetsp:Transcript_60934/g.139395  ORF Transcript_60934/g.139395 Transcript_60934/m.139395 type:complete len:242 (+) Transcript_60934:800-1525(+)